MVCFVDSHTMAKHRCDRIDIGNDDTSFKLQQKAIDNLFFDPAYQRSHNEKHVAAAQLAHNDGLTTTLREWTLQGTELRELLVPELDAVSQLSRNARKDDDDFDLLDDTPAAKLARLPAVTLPLSVPPETASNPSSSFADNQLINSWIKRHQRDKPMRMTGDPELNLNESQTKAVAMALGERLSLIQGVSSLQITVAWGASLNNFFSAAASRNWQISDDRVHDSPPEATLPRPATHLVERTDPCLGGPSPIPAHSCGLEPASNWQGGQGSARAARVDCREAQGEAPAVEKSGGGQGRERGQSCAVARVAR